MPAIPGGMDAPELPESPDRTLNRAVAVTVLLLSVGLALGKIKDDNIVQAMQQDMSTQVDCWSEYQATRLKLHSEQIAAAEFGLNPAAPAQAAAAEARRDAARYARESAALKAQAQDAAADYNARGRRDDQFDLGDGFGSIALAVSAVAAVVESRRLLALGWAFGAAALLFVVAGFAELPIHPDRLVAFLT